MNDRSDPPPGHGGARFTLRQLEAFLTVIRLGSVSAAATRLSRTQSAVSMAIQDLEHALGTTLFGRHGRRLVATEAAERLLPRALEMIDRSQEISGLLGTSEDVHHPVAIGASRTVGPALMPAIVRAARQTPAALRVTLTIRNSEALLAMVRSFDLDVAFVEGDVTDTGLECEPWLQDRLCLVARADHPVHARRGPIARRLEGLQWALRERGSGTREIFMRAIQPALGTPDVAVEVDEPETQKRIVRQTDLITCMSARAFDPAADGLAEIDGLGRDLRQGLRRRFWIVRHAQRYRREAVRRVIDSALAMGSGALTRGDTTPAPV